MDKVIVANADRHRSTGEVALGIGDQLTRVGLSVDVQPFGRAGAARDNCAVIAVYCGP